MARAGRPLSELTQGFERFPQITVNVRVAEKRPIDQLPALQKAIKEVEAELAGRGRVLIRYSGTEPKARIMVEGEDATRVETFARDLADELQRALAGVNGD
jgi:phosphoglucosamine mutase